MIKTVAGGGGRRLAGGDAGLGALGGALGVGGHGAALAAQQPLLVALLLGQAALGRLLPLLAGAAAPLLAVLAALLLRMLAAPRRRRRHRARVAALLDRHAAARLHPLQRHRRRVLAVLLLLRPDVRQPRGGLLPQQALGRREVARPHAALRLLLRWRDCRSRREALGVLRLLLRWRDRRSRREALAVLRLLLRWRDRRSRRELVRPLAVLRLLLRWLDRRFRRELVRPLAALRLLLQWLDRRGRPGGEHQEQQHREAPGARHGWLAARTLRCLAGFGRWNCWYVCVCYHSQLAPWAV
uniref:Uncharacterized protein n=1 Tax=Aegilops tauschii subsp. strangulata TaxID=200361 RepID=A0A453DG42_AEGTS